MSHEQLVMSFLSPGLVDPLARVDGVGTKDSFFNSLVCVCVCVCVKQCIVFLVSSSLASKQLLQLNKERKDQ